MSSLAWPDVAPTLTDGVVTMRPLAASDADDVLAGCQDPEIQRWTRLPVPYLPEHALGFTTTFAREQWATRRGAPFAVVPAGGGRLLGSCGLVSVDERDLVGVAGYWVAPWARGRKVAQRSSRLLCDWALGEGGLARVEFYVEPDNAASCGVVEGIGCTREGILRSKTLHRGARRDLSIYALVKDADGNPGRA